MTSINRIRHHHLVTVAAVGMAVVLLFAGGCGGDSSGDGAGVDLNPTVSEPSASDLDLDENDLVRDAAHRAVDDPQATPKRKVWKRGVLFRDFHRDKSLKAEWEVTTFDNFVPGAAPEGSWENHGRYEKYYPGGKLLQEKATYFEGKLNGEWTSYHRNDQEKQVAKHGEFVNGKLNGEWKTFREDGTLVSIKHYAAGQLDGICQWFANDGTTVIEQKSYSDGKRHGKWTKTDSSTGKLREEQYFKDNRPHGVYQSWYSNGQKQTEIHFRDGKRHGAYRQWDDKGTETGSFHYDNGKQVRR